MLKYFFRKFLSGILPERILGKRKKGFSIRWKSWIAEREDLRPRHGDGLFFKRDLRLPDNYTILCLQSWLKQHTLGTTP